MDPRHGDGKHGDGVSGATATPGSRVRLFCLLGILVAAWVALATLVVPAVIESAYRGRYLSWFISAPDTRPLEYYLARWSAMATKLTCVLALVSVSLWVVSRPAFRRLVDAGLGVVPSDDPPDPLLGPGRKRFLSLVIGLVLAGSLFTLVMSTEHWPFSRYSMYSQVRRTYTLDLPRLVGVVEGTGEERQLYEFKYIQPFDQARLRGALANLLRRPNSGPLLEEAVGDCLRRYEARRRAGAHHGPPLQALRLYRLGWDLDPWARNVDRPDRKQLILEVRSPGERG